MRGVITGLKSLFSAEAPISAKPLATDGAQDHAVWCVHVCSLRSSCLLHMFEIETYVLFTKFRTTSDVAMGGNRGLECGFVFRTDTSMPA